MSMMIEYYAVVVLYNKRVQDSITISCLMKLKEEEVWLLPVTNSPRMGVCGYEGSRVYPEQFEPDEIC